MRFPFVFKNAQITINRIQLFAFVKRTYKGSDNAQTLQFWLNDAPSQPAQPS